MRTIPRTIHYNPPDEHAYALRRGPGGWEVTFAGWQADFPHETVALYVAWLLLHPHRKPVHAVALALDARKLFGPSLGAEEALELCCLGLDEAETARDMRRQERELEAVLDDRDEIEPVKAEALRELEAMAEYRRGHPWRSRECIQQCARAVSRDIEYFVAQVAQAADEDKRPHPVLKAFAGHLNEHLFIHSDGGGIPGRFRVGAALPGYFTYQPPNGVVWRAEAGLQ